MSAPLVPSPLDFVGRRGFSLYPPMHGAGRNQWFLRSSGWSEVQIVNAIDGRRAWLPRHYICGVSHVDEPLLVVELTQQLDLRDGVILPATVKVIEMPCEENPAKRSVRRRRKNQKAQVVEIRAEHASSRRLRLLARIGLAGVIMLVLSAAGVILCRL